MDETNWSSDFYSDIFSLGFDSLFNTIDLESLESKENSDTVPEVLNTTNRESERAVLAETTMETNNLPAPDESGFPLTSTEQIRETIKEAENKNTLRSANTWMRVWYSRAKSRQINESIETMAPATLDGVLSGNENSRAVLEAKAKQLRMNGYGKRKNCALPYNFAEEVWNAVCIKNTSYHM